ncbi:MAG: hypothetical protein JSV72_24840, partial [Ralstonia sp.]
VACLICGYNMRTLAAHQTCPECGHAVAYSTKGYLIRLDADGRIAHDLRCITCGYNLRLQPATGICPECGNRAAPSLRGYYLQFAPPPWVRGLAGGVLVIVVSLAAAVGVWILAMMATVFAPAPDPEPILICAAFGLVACVIGGIVGAARVTASTPLILQERRFSARWVARHSAWIAAVLLACGALGLAGTMPGSNVLVWVVGVLVFAGFLFGYGIFPLSLTRHLRALVRRIPRRGLATFTTVVFWLHAIVCVLALAGNTASMMYAIGMSTTLATPTTTTTTFPASSAVTSMSVTAVAAPPVGMGALMVLTVLGGFAGCLSGPVLITAFVMLILVQRALAAAARAAAANAAAIGSAPAASQDGPG